MSHWTRDQTSRLVRIESNMADNGFNQDNVQIQNMPILQDRCYPTRSSLPTCIRLPLVNGNNFEIKPNYISMLPKFTGLESEDAYVFISEFEEVCMMMRLQQLSEDAIKLRLIPFALKDNAKKWLYSIPTNSISSWDEFVKVFLKKFYPNHKTARIRNEINQFHQLPNEPFWKYFDRFKDLLIQCPHHAIEKWRLCQIIYEGLDFNSKAMLESMCQGEFMMKNENDAWNFLEDLSEKTIQWENTHINSENNKTNQRGGMHHINNSIASEAKIDALRRRIEALEVNPSSPNLCFFCHDTNHSADQCPNTGNQEQGNAIYQRTRNDPFSQTYNPGWKNHPNFSWNSGNFQNSNFQNQNFPNQNPGFQNSNFQNQNQNFSTQNFQNHGFQNPQFQNPNFQNMNFQNQGLQNSFNQFGNQRNSYAPPGFSNDHDKRLTTLEKSLESFLRTSNQTNQTLTQNITANTQAIARMEIQIGQIANRLNERERGTFPSQPIPNPRDQRSNQVHQIQEDRSCHSLNAVTVLESDKKVDNHVIIPNDPPTSDSPASIPPAISQPSQSPPPQWKEMFEDLFHDELEILEELGPLSDHTKTTPLVGSFEDIFEDELDFIEKLGQSSLQINHKPNIKPLIFEEPICDESPQHVYKPLANHIIQNMLGEFYIWPVFSASYLPVKLKRFFPVEAVRKENFKVD